LEVLFLVALAELNGTVEDEATHLAKDLGGTGDAADGPTACQAAIKAMGDLKGKMGASAAFAIDDTLAILRAVRGEHTTQTHTTTERTFAVGRAIASGGLLISKKSTRTDTKTREEREQVLFLFRKAGDAWVVRESCTLFEGLAELMAASVAENLVRLIAELRARAPDATFDDRLTRFHTADAQASSRLDEQAHLLALAIVRLGRGPYR